MNTVDATTLMASIISQTRGTIETWRVYLCHSMYLCYRVGLWVIPCNRQVSQLSEWKRACTVWCVLLLRCLETRMCQHPCAAGCIFQPVYFPMFHHSYGEGELTTYQSVPCEEGQADDYGAA